MKRCKNTIWLTRCLGYPLAINVLSCTVMLLYANSVVKDITSLIILLAIYLVAAPLYPVVKGNSHKPLFYNVTSIIAHLVFGFITVSALGHIYKGWETAMFMYAEMFTTIFFVITVLLDTILHAVKKLKAKHS